MSERTAAWIAMAMALTSGVSHGADAPTSEQQPFGRLEDGSAVTLFVLRNAGGMVVRAIDYGATLVAVEVPDRSGAIANVVYGCADLDGYLKPGPHGSTIGRFANRIARGKFVLDGHEYALAVNNGPNHLHGGKRGFSRVLWRGELHDSPDGPAVRFSRRSADGEEGYPGNLDVTVTFTLTADNALRIDYTAAADKPTPLNLTNHAYFNLSGADPAAAQPVVDHLLTIHADHYLVADETLIPTGELAPVAGTALDFRAPTRIGQNIADVPGMKSGGFDHCYVVRGGGRETLIDVAQVSDPKSGRTMHVASTEPGVQLYTARVGASSNKSGRDEKRNPTAFCLETQHFPDSPNRPAFPDVILRPGQTFQSSTIYRFSVAP